jgi:hypothetical protein
MDQLGGTHDGIDRTRRHAQRAAYACILVDERDCFWLGNPMRSVQRERAYSQQLRQFTDTLFASGRTLIDRGASFRDSGGIGFAAIEAALAALGLRQYGVDFRY